MVDEMQHQQMGYDRVATMFSPNGHILQVEYAEKTIRLGSASIGIVCKDGVVLVADRRQKEKLVIEESANKINEIDEHIMSVSAGMIADARVLIEKARVLAQQHRVTYDSQPATESIVKDIADMKQQFTQYGGARPFGVASMFAGYDSKPVLYTTDVTGSYLRYKANAIGQNDDKIREKLREKYKQDLTCKEAIKIALDIFKEILGDEYAIERFDAGIIKEDKKIQKVSGKDLENLK
ncbi:MAG: archaeal proteasome endopeptidase complex subunit alpha [Candidatus Nanoarchaeia archaeon]